MNQPSNHTNQSQPGTEFPSQPQSNPFTADLKGEFSSNFGTNTNAVSQIFKEGGFTGGGNSKWIAIGVAVLLVLAGAYFFLLGEEEDPFATNDVAETLNVDEPAIAPEEGIVEEEAIAEDEQAVAEDAAPMEDVAPVEEAAPVATGSVVLVAPVDGDSRAYDETKGPAVFQWEGGSGTIVFSRNASMRPAYMRVPVSGSSYSFYNPFPGKWFWQVESADGASEIRAFTVDAAQPRNVALSEPTAGGTVAANGGQVSWQGDSKVAFYRVEFSADGSWTNPAYRFATSGVSVQTQGMNPGQYQVRVGAFSEVAGRWEYTTPVNVSVQ